MGKKLKAVTTMVLTSAMIIVSFAAAGQSKAAAAAATDTAIATTTAIAITTITAKATVKATVTEYITVEEYAKALVEAVGLEPLLGSEGSGNVAVLIANGIIKEGDFTSYTKDLTRGDALILLNRAEEYLNKDTIDAALVQTVIDKRISDISKVTEAKRKDVAEAYLKGFIKGYSNGEYCTDRKLKLTSKITKTGALESIRMLTNKKLRAKISPDGQLIRTTKLPKYAKYYPYILASFPNEYYDWKFFYEGVVCTRNGKVVEEYNLIDYTAPVDVNIIMENGDFTTNRKEREEKWLSDAKLYFTNLLNVDYRTIDETWINSMIDNNDAYKFNESMIRTALERYLTKMKKNKTIVECKSIDMDASSIYYYDYAYFLRVHVNYRIVSSVASLNEDIDSLLKSQSHNSILFCTTMVNIRKRTLGKWQDGYYEIQLCSYEGGISGSTILINDASYRAKKVE